MSWATSNTPPIVGFAGLKVLAGLLEDELVPVGFGGAAFVLALFEPVVTPIELVVPVVGILELPAPGTAVNPCEFVLVGVGALSSGSSNTTSSSSLSLGARMSLSSS